MNIKLHHFAYKIKPNTLEVVLDMFKIFNCNLTYRDGEKRWCMIGQKTIPIDIQITEKNYDTVKPLEKKINTHIAFISDNPKKDIGKIKEWCKKKGVKFETGNWNEKEFWFDLPEIFIDFVVEIMDKSVVE